MDCCVVRRQPSFWERSLTVAAVPNLLEMVVGCTNPWTPLLSIAVKNTIDNRYIASFIDLLPTWDFRQLFIVAIPKIGYDSRVLYREAEGWLYFQLFDGVSWNTSWKDAFWGDTNRCPYVRVLTGQTIPWIMDIRDSKWKLPTLQTTTTRETTRFLFLNFE